MRKAKIKDDNGKLIEVDIDKFKKHLDEYHSTGSSLHEENGHYFTVDKNFRDKIESLYLCASSDNAFNAGTSTGFASDVGINTISLSASLTWEEQ